MGSLPSPHVVMVPIDTAGHCVPFVLFGERLIAEGFTVTILTTDAHIEEIFEDPAARESSLRYVGLRDDTIGRNRKAVFDERNTDAGREKVIKLVVEAIEDMCSPNAMQLRGVPTAAFPCVIMNDFLTTWAQDAADMLGIQKHLLFVSPVSALAITLQVPLPTLSSIYSFVLTFNRSAPNAFIMFVVGSQSVCIMKVKFQSLQRMRTL